MGRVVFDLSRGITGDRSGAVKAIQAARPVSGDTSRTSISEDKAVEEESLGITQDGAGASLWEKYDLSRELEGHTTRVWVYSTGTQKVQKTANLRQGGRSTPML